MKTEANKNKLIRVWQVLTSKNKARIFLLIIILVIFFVINQSALDPTAEISVSYEENEFISFDILKIIL